MGNWIYEFDIAALFYMSIILWMLLKFKNLPIETNKYFKYLMITAITATITDLLGIYVLEPTVHVPFPLQNLAQIIYLIPNMFCAIFYFLLSCAMTKPYRKPTKWRNIFILIVAVADTLVVITSPFTHLYFYIEDGIYKHGPLMTFRYALAALIMLIVLADTMRFHRLMTKAQKRMVYGYTVLCLSALVLQSLLENVVLLNFAISASALLGYFALQNPSDFIDDITGLKNKHSFNHTVASYFQQRDSFSLICVDYRELNYVDSIMGASTTYSIIHQLAVRLTTKFSRSWVYRISHTTFVIMVPHKPENLSSLVSDIQALDNDALIVNGAKLKFNPIISTLHAPESFSYAEDAADAIRYSLRQAELSPETGYYCDINESSLIKKRREAAILHVLKRAIDNREFEVVYQPVYSCKKGTFTRAEALARLNDKTLGMVSPAEFIAVAEQNSLMTELGEIILDTVCSFVNKCLRQGLTLERVSINLSPVQCLQPHFYDLVLATAERHGVPLNMLEFEVTAKMMQNTRETLLPLMEKLTAAGVNFIIDDYSFNFTDAHMLTSVLFDGIKISREATKLFTEQPRILPALEHSVLAFRELNHSVIATGIESAEQAESFKGFGCDFLQGFYYFKPISAEKMFDELRRKK